MLQHIASPNNYPLFEEYLQRLSRFGNGQSKEEADTAGQILEVFNKARSGVLGKSCVCGRPGEFVRTVQPAPSWSRQPYVFCRGCCEEIDRGNKVLDRIVAASYRPKEEK